MGDEKRVPRYDYRLEFGSYMTTAWVEFDEYEDGDWCKAKDVEKLEAELAEARALLRRTLEYLRIPRENDDAELRALRRAIPKALQAQPEEDRT